MQAPVASGLEQEWEVPLHSFTLGMWKPRRHRGLSLLVVPEDRLVVLCDRQGVAAPKSPVRAALRTLGATASPFQPSARWEARGCVVAVELPLDKVRGLNWSAPLFDPGCLAVECKAVRKREFPTIAAARAYYSEQQRARQQGGSSGDEPAGDSASAAAGLVTPPSSPECGCSASQTPAGSPVRAGPPLLASPPLFCLGRKSREEGAAAGTLAGSSEVGGMPRLGRASLGSGPADQQQQQQQQQQWEGHRTTASAGASPSSSPTRVRFRLDSAPAPNGLAELGGAFAEERGGQGEGSPLRAARSAGELGGGGGGRGPGGSQAWPPAHAWTATSRVYEYRTACLYWRDPRLPGLLRPVVQGNEQLLRLYESGLPAWAVFLPTYGFFYRPWLRTITWLLFYAFSVFSLVMGFFDLYKNLPGFQLLLKGVMRSVWLPPAAVLEWLEGHAQIRLSILLTYLFGKSEAMVWAVRLAGNCARVVKVALRPLLAAVGPPASLLLQSLQLLGSQAWQGAGAALAALLAVLQAGLAPLAAVLAGCWSSLAAVALPLWHALASAAGPGWEAAREWGVALGAAARGVRSGAAAAKSAVAAGRAAGQSGSALAEQAAWLYVVPGDALGVLRSSAIKVARALQVVGKFIAQLCHNAWRHRLTLSLRAARAWARLKAKMQAAAAAPVRLVLRLAQWVFVAVGMLFLDVIEAGHRRALERERRRRERQERERRRQQQPAADEGPANGDAHGKAD